MSEIKRDLFLKLNTSETDNYEELVSRRLLIRRLLCGFCYTTLSSIIDTELYLKRLSLPFKGVEGIWERGTPLELKEYFNWLHEGGGGMLWSTEM